jgi:hypothetical protein
VEKVNQTCIDGLSKIVKRKPESTVYENAPATDLNTDPIDVTLVGYRVATADGKAGRVDDPMMDLNKRYLLVSVGRFLRKTRLVPLGVVAAIDRRERTVFLKWTTSEVKHAAEAHPLPWLKRTIDYRSRNHG